MATKSLRSDQIEDLSKFMAFPKHAALSDPGTGKTPPICVLQQYYWEDCKERTIWAQPGSLLRKNYQELLDFTDFTPDDICIYAGTPAQREALLKKDYKVFLTTATMFGKEWKEIKRAHRDTKAVIVDEMHMCFKGNESMRTKQLYQALETMNHFVPMSGTLIDGRLDSAYSTIKGIEPRYYYDYQSFLKIHAELDEYDRVIFWKNHERLGQILARHSVRRTFAEVHGVEKPVFQTELCEMKPKQWGPYNDMEDRAMVELEDRFLEAQNPAVASIRCRQIMQCPQVHGILGPTELTGKEEALLLHIEDHVNTRKPFVIYGVFLAELQRIAELCRLAGLRVGEINSTVLDAQKAKIDQEFQAGLLDVVVASPGTASVGFNWQHIEHIIYSSIDYRDTNFDQSYKRGIRRKREKPLRVTLLRYADCAVESRVFAIVQQKSNDRHKVDPSYDKISIY